MSGLTDAQQDWDQYVSTTDRVEQLLHSLEERQSRLQDLQSRTVQINAELDRLHAAYTAARAVCDDVAIIAILDLLTSTHTQRLSLMRLHHDIVVAALPTSPAITDSQVTSVDAVTPIRITSDEGDTHLQDGEFTGLFLQSDADTAIPIVVHSPLVDSTSTLATVEVITAPEVAPQLDDEAEELLNNLVAEVQTTWTGLSQQVTADYTIPPATLFRIRSVVCQIRGIKAEYSVYQPQPPVMSKLEEILSDIAFCCMNGTSDCLIRIKLDDRALDEGETPTEFWSQLSKNYRLVAEAQDAITWCKQNNYYPIELLNTIGARQQMLHLTLQPLRFTDENQLKLFHDIRANQGDSYLSGLSSTLEYNDLASIAGKLPSELKAAERMLEENIATKQRNLQRDEALRQLRSLFENRPDFGTDNSTYDQDKNALHAALDACVNAGIPPSCKDITSLIGPCADRLLRGTARFKNHMKFAMDHLSKTKRDEEAEKLDKEQDIEVTDAQMREWITSLKAAVQGKVLTIAGGGRPQDNIVSALKSNLPFTDVSWLYGEQLSSSRKIQSNIKKSDIFLVVIKYISHDVSESGKKWIQAKGGDFIALRAGFGFKSILKALVDTYVTRDIDTKD